VPCVQRNDSLCRLGPGCDCCYRCARTCWSGSRFEDGNSWCIVKTFVR
jgi:hypothetical protein